MIAKQTVFLTGDRSQAVPEGHADAKFLLVREGHDIEEALIEKHDAMDLVNSAATAKPEPAPSREHAPAPNPPPAAKPEKVAKSKKAPKAKK